MTCNFITVQIHSFFIIFKQCNYLRPVLWIFLQVWLLCVKHLGMLVSVVYFNTARNRLSHLHLYYSVVRESYYSLRQQGGGGHKKVCKNYKAGRFRLVLLVGIIRTWLLFLYCLSVSIVHCLAIHTDQLWYQMVHRFLFLFLPEN